MRCDSTISSVLACGTIDGYMDWCLCREDVSNWVMHDELVSELRVWGAGLFLTIEGAGEIHTGWQVNWQWHNSTLIPFCKALNFLVEGLTCQILFPKMTDMCQDGVIISPPYLVSKVLHNEEFKILFKEMRLITFWFFFSFCYTAQNRDAIVERTCFCAHTPQTFLIPPPPPISKRIHTHSHSHSNHPPAQQCVLSLHSAVTALTAKWHNRLSADWVCLNWVAWCSNALPIVTLWLFNRCIQLKLSPLFYSI